RDRDEGLDVRVASQDRVVGDDDPVAKLTIVRDVHVDHQEVVGTDAREPVFLFTTPVDGHSLADHVAVTDLDAGLAAAIRRVLGLAADDGKGMDDVLLAQSGPAEDAGVGDQARAPADLHFRPDDAIGPDLHIVAQLGARIDAGRVGNQSGHDPRVPPIREIARGARAVTTGLAHSQAAATGRSATAPPWPLAARSAST